MKLNDYLLKYRITTRQFAKQMGHSMSAVSKWRIKNRLPRPAAIARIEKLTKGRVRLQDWY